MSIASIARTTILEALREKILYGLVVFGIGMVLLSVGISSLALGHRIRVVTDLSLTAILTSGILLAVILGANAVARDIERRVILPILAKPLNRTSYILGRFLGVLAVVAMNYGVMVAFATCVIALNSPDSGFPYGWSTFVATIALIFLRIVVVAALAVTLSCLSSPTIAQVSSIAFAVAGHFTSELKFFLSKEQGPLGQTFAEVVYRTVPDLGALDSLYELIHGRAVATSHLGLCAAYALLYAAAALLLGCWTFARRELS